MNGSRTGKRIVTVMAGLALAATAALGVPALGDTSVRTTHVADDNNNGTPPPPPDTSGFIWDCVQVDPDLPPVCGWRPISD